MSKCNTTVQSLDHLPAKRSIKVLSPHVLPQWKINKLIRRNSRTHGSIMRVLRNKIRMRGLELEAEMIIARAINKALEM